MNCHRVDVNARYREAQPLQHFPGVKGGLIGRLDEVSHRLGDESSRTARRVKDLLVQRLSYQLPHDGPGQPGGGIVFPQLAPFICRYHGLVQDGGNVIGSLLPVESWQRGGPGS